MSNGGTRPGAGRPKGSVNKLPSKAAELNERLADKTSTRFDEITDELFRIALHGKHDADRLKAIMYILDRALGKTPEVVQVEAPGAVQDVEKVLELWKSK